MANVTSAPSSPTPTTTAAPAATPARERPWLVRFYASALGKKYVMAITGIVWLGYVFAHMVGNLKLYMGAESLDGYAEWLRALGYPALPETVTLWLLRSVLIVALVLHVHAAYALTLMNRRARPTPYQSRRDWVAADFAGRTMRWTGVIVLLFLIWHLADFTWGVEAVNPEFTRGQVYDNVVASFSRPAVSVWYLAANLALGLHIYHGTWSLFQSLGWNSRRSSARFNQWRRWFATAFTVVVIGGNLTFPIAVMTGIVG